MNSPFPGMNPYLENPVFWAEVHHRLITALADTIEENIPPEYRVAIGQRTYLGEDSDSLLTCIHDISAFTKQTSSQQYSLNNSQTSTSDGITVMIPLPEHITENYLEIREVSTGFVVTSIEVLSPKNKRPGEGRKAYELKRKQI